MWIDLPTHTKWAKTNAIHPPQQPKCGVIVFSMIEQGGRGEGGKGGTTLPTLHDLERELYCLVLSE